MSAIDEPAAKKAKVDESATPKEPEAKRAKTEVAKAVEAKTVRKQVEYYLSDENLRHDKFFHDKIASDEGGWLDMTFVLSCNKMKIMGATKEDVVKALVESKLELKDGGAAVRRPGNAALPKLEARQFHHQKKSVLHAHDGGAIVVFKDLPAEINWETIKATLKEKLQEKAKATVWWASQVTDKNECFIAASPFEGDLEYFKAIELELGGKKLKCEICYDDQLQKVVKMLPKHIKDKRDNSSKKRAKERNKPILVGKQHFVNIGALKGKVKEIMNSRSDGEQLKQDGTDFKLVKALLEFHPKGAEKFAGLIGIKVAKSPYQDSRCFYMIKEGGVEEDVSMMKCIAAVEQNPPYAQVAQKKDDKGKDKKEAPAASSAAGSKPAETAKPMEVDPKPTEEFRLLPSVGTWLAFPLKQVPAAC